MSAQAANAAMVYTQRSDSKYASRVLTIGLRLHLQARSHDGRRGSQSMFANEKFKMTVE